MRDWLAAVYRLRLRTWNGAKQASPMPNFVRPLSRAVLNLAGTARITALESRPTVTDAAETGQQQFLENRPRENP